MHAASPVLAFSTLACPGWQPSTVVERAVAMGFDGIEWRGGPEGTVSTATTSRERAVLRVRVEDAGLRSIGVTAYSNLISGRAEEVRRSVDELRAHVELAAELGAPAVRAFLGVRDDDAGEQTLLERATAALAAALETARSAGVVIAIEPHDDHVTADAVMPVLRALPDASLGVVWDVANAWAAGEDPESGLAAYAGRIAYVQVKDGAGRGADWALRPIGAGDVPLGAALGALTARAAATDTPLPPISIEWERAWHPELDPAEVALPAGLAHLGAILAPHCSPAGSPP